QRAAHGDREGIGAERPRPLVRREIVADEGIGGGAAPRLADPDADPRREEMPEGMGETAESGHGAPQAEADGDDPGPAEAVRQSGDGDAEACVEEREGEPAHEAEL